MRTAYKRKSKLRTCAGRTSARPEPHGFFAMIQLDIALVKEELLRKWKKAERDFEKQQKEWDAYCNEDRPAYEKWLHATFGSRLTELRELHEQIERKNWFVEQLECLSTLSGKTPRKLYLELQKKTKSGMSMHDAMVEYVNEFNTSDDDDFEADENDGTEEDFEKIFEAFEDIQCDSGKTRAGNHTPRIRDVYRKLCFKLHPDTGCDFNAENSRLWHQIQEAYQKNDLDSLLAIQASLDMKQDPMAGHISCTQILALIEDFKNGLRSVRTLIRDAQRESSWNFLKWSDKERKTAMRQLEEQLGHDLLNLKYEKEYLESIEKKWSRPAAVRNRPKPKPKVKPQTKPRTKEKSHPPDYSSPAEQFVKPGLFHF